MEHRVDHPDRRLAGIFAGDLAVADRVGVFDQRGPRRQQVARGACEAFTAAPAGAAARSSTRPSTTACSTPLLDRTLEPGQEAHPGRPRRADPQQARGRRQPAGLDRRPGHVAEVRRLRRRPGDRPGRHACSSASGSLPTLGVCVVLPRWPATMAPNLYLYQQGYDRTAEDAAGAARRPRPADHLGRVRASASTPRCPRWPATPTAAGRGVRPGAAGDADRPRPRRRPARARRAHPRAGAEGLRRRDGAGRRARHPDRPGAAGAVAGDPGQAPAARRGAGAEGGGQDPGPADLLHPARACSSRCSGRPGSGSWKRSRELCDLTSSGRYRCAASSASRRSSG